MNIFNLEEISIFFRYRTFPLFLSIIILSSFAHVLWAYFKSKKKEILFLALVLFTLFAKECLLFLTTRHVVFDFQLKRTDYHFFHWMLFECFFNFFALSGFMAMFGFFTFDSRFSYPLPSLRNRNFFIYFSLHFLFFVIVSGLIFLGYLNGYDFSILFPIFTIYYLLSFFQKRKGILQMYKGFDIYFLKKDSLKKLNYFLFSFLLILVFFGLSSIAFLPFQLFIKDFYVDVDVFFDFTETYFHGFKSITYALLGMYVIDFIRAENLSVSLEEQRKKDKKNELSAFFKQLRSLFIKGTSSKEIALFVMDKIKKETQAEMVIFLFDHRDKRVSEFSIGSVFFEGEHINAFMLPYLSRIESARKDFLIDSLENLEDVVKYHFFYFPQKKKVISEEGKVKIFNENDGISGENLEKQEHYVSNLLVKLCRNDWEKSKITLIAINKQSDTIKDAKETLEKDENTKVVWDKKDAFLFLEVIGEEIIKYSDYLIDYEKYQKEYRKKIEKRLSFEINLLIKETNDFYIERQMSLSKAPIKISVLPVFPKKYVKSFSRIFYKDTDEVVLLNFDVVGNHNWIMLFHSIMQMVFNRLVQEKKPLDAMMTEFNRVISQYKQDSFVNALLLSFDVKKKSVAFCNASHQPPIFFLKKKSDILMHDIKGYPLGVKEDEKYIIKKVSLKKDDIVVIYSENILNIKSKDHQEKYDLSRFADIVSDRYHEDVKTLNQLLIQDVVSFFDVKDMGEDKKLWHDDDARSFVEEEHLIVVAKF